jgi:preprotein translocase SecE subunit
MLKKIFFPFIITKDFLKQTFLELKRSEWLSKENTFRYSILVIVAIIISLLFILGVDKVFLGVRNFLL